MCFDSVQRFEERVEAAIICLLGRSESALGKELANLERTCESRCR